MASSIATIAVQRVHNTCASIVASAGPFLVDRWLRAVRTPRTQGIYVTEKNLALNAK